MRFASTKCAYRSVRCRKKASAGRCRSAAGWVARNSYCCRFVVGIRFHEEAPLLSVNNVKVQGQIHSHASITRPYEEYKKNSYIYLYACVNIPHNTTINYSTVPARFYIPTTASNCFGSLHRPRPFC